MLKKRQDRIRIHDTKTIGTEITYRYCFADLFCVRMISISQNDDAVIFDNEKKTEPKSKDERMCTKE